MRRTLLNDNGPTRVLERAATAWPAPAVARKPSPDEAGRQRDDQPQGQRPRANRGARQDERVRIARRACQRDAHLEVAGAGARTVPTGRQVLRERGALDQRQLAVQLGVDLGEPLLVRGICHQTSSRMRYRRARRCIQRTANASCSDRHTRFHIPYLVTPYLRGRWPTGTSVTVPPSILIKVGRNRCIPVNNGRARTASVRKALSEQPVSRITSPLSRLRTPLAMRLCRSEEHTSELQSRGQ